MDRVLLLKTQLAEAAKLAKQKTYRYKRLAVILLNNFIEIQLASLIQRQFDLDDILDFDERKYSKEQRKLILRHHDALLKATVEENIINYREKKLISFCHDVRNSVYHKIDEDELLIDVSLIILQQIIQIRQPEWQTVRGFTSLGVHDPYDTRKKKEYQWYDETKKKGYILLNNDKNDWKYFLSKYFKFVDKRKKSASKILADYLLGKMEPVRDTLNLVRSNDWKTFFPETRDWKYNDFLRHYSFLVLKKEEIEKVKDKKDKEEQRRLSEQLFIEYCASWRNRSEHRLISLRQSIEEIRFVPIEKALEKYVSLREEVNFLYETFNRAYLDYEEAINWKG